MSFKQGAFFSVQHAPKLLMLSLTLILSACGSNSDDDDDGNASYIQMYNASKNAPAVFLTIDENLEEDDDDEIELTYSSVGYGIASTLKTLENDTYFYELAWQSEDSTDRSDLTLIAQGQIEVKKDAIQFMVLSEDITTPAVEIYNIEVVSDDDDATNDLFNVRFLNMQNDAVDVYMSESDETFNEAELIGQYSKGELSDNLKYDQDEYIYYLTKAGENDVLYQSSEVDFAYASQYVMAIRENLGTGTSPFAIDRISSSSTTEYLDANSQAQFRVYNAISSHELLANYQEQIDVYINGVDDEPEVSNLVKGSFSDTLVEENGDYSIDVSVANTDERLLKNNLLTLAENANKTVFLYLKEDDVDHDGDGDVDEDGDGLVDEIEISINSLIVSNSVNESIYYHDISLVNLVDNDEFSSIKFYFVRSNETIETADYSRSVSYTSAETLSLRNNTYQVFAVAQENSSDIILSSFEFVLDESSTGQFIIIEQDEYSSTGYKITLAEQVAL